jgi:hypothetical protein
MSLQKSWPNKEIVITTTITFGSNQHRYRYHKYARVGVKLLWRELYFDHNKNLWAPQNCAYATLQQSVANLMFHNVSFNFATAISKFDTFSSYHIVCTWCKTIVVPYVDINVKVTNFFPFCTIGISVCQKRILPYFVIPSTFSPQASFTLSHHRQTDNILHPLLPTSLSGKDHTSLSYLFVRIWS